MGAASFYYANCALNKMRLRKQSWALGPHKPLPIPEKLLVVVTNAGEGRPPPLWDGDLECG